MARFAASILVMATFAVGVLGASAQPQTAPPPQSLSAPPPSAPTDMAALYPNRAQRMNVEGRVTFQCIANLDGTLSDCSIVSEDPPGYGFGDATLKLTHLFRARPEALNGAPIAGRVFRKTVVWKLSKK
jgi:protein TonB